MNGLLGTSIAVLVGVLLAVIYYRGFIYVLFDSSELHP